MILVNECTAGVDGTYWYNWMRMIQTILAHCSDGWSLLLFILLFFFLVWLRNFLLILPSLHQNSAQILCEHKKSHHGHWCTCFLCAFLHMCVYTVHSLPCTHTGLSSAWKRSHEGNINLCVTISANRSIGLHLHPLFFLCLFCLSLIP